MRPLAPLAFTLTAFVACSQVEKLPESSDQATATQASASATKRISSAASFFYASLSEEQRAAASLSFEDNERRSWNFLPNVYPGVTLADLSDDQRVRLHGLLNAALSDAGYHKTTTIMGLEDVLRAKAEAAGREQEVPMRDPGRYAVALFGFPPAESEPWGFRFQGHHVSWNFTWVDGRFVGAPAFLGSNPGELREGAHAGLRALPDEEDLARELLAALEADQLASAVVSEDPPGEIFFAPGKSSMMLGRPRGLRYGDMSLEARRILRRLISAYVDNLHPDVAFTALLEIETAGLDDIHFAWMGSLERGRGHYYRIHGSGFAIEYDNVQNGANHVHAVWHDLKNDFGLDLLRAHREAEHAGS